METGIRLARWPILLILALLSAGAVSGATPAAGTTFADVPASHWAHGFIEMLFQGGFIVGCQATPVRNYCPDEVLTRAEAAVFVVRGVHGGDFLPPEPGSSVFSDVALGTWHAKWVHQLWTDGFTAGCASSPLAFCPAQGHTRAEAAVFFVRILRGKDYVPPEPGSLPYTDVARGAWYFKWVGAAYAAGIVQGCEDDANRGDDRYRPQAEITRAEAACMLAKAKEMSPDPTPTPSPSPTPRPTQPPAEGHTYPRSAVFTWCCEAPQYWAQFDLVMSRETNPALISEVRRLHPGIIWLITEDINCGDNWFRDKPDAWMLYDSHGNSVGVDYCRGGNSPNLSDVGPRANGQHYVDALAEAIVERVLASGADGFMSDGLYYTGHYSWYTPEDIDLDRNGLNDIVEHGESWFLDHWRQGIDGLLDRVRAGIGPDRLLVINTGSADCPNCSQINGLYFENTGGETNWDYSRATVMRLHASSFQPPLFVMNLRIDPRNTTNPGRTYNDFQYVRFGLARALLLGEYIDILAWESGEHYWSEYYDEFDLELGYPTGEMQHIGGGVWVRFFDRGAVIANINSHPVTVSDQSFRTASGYAGPYWRFQGCQDPALNNGQPFISVELKGHVYTGYQDTEITVGDGIVLVSNPTTACPTIMRPPDGYWRDNR